MESDDNDIPEAETVKQPQKNEINITHEDLSDVSDLEDSMGDSRTDNDEADNNKIVVDKEKTELDDDDDTTNIQNSNFGNDVNKVVIVFNKNLKLIIDVCKFYI